MAEKTVSVHIVADELDATIEKANRLLELLEEVSKKVDSLYGKRELEP